MLPVLLLLPCLESCSCTGRMEAGGYSHLPHSAGWCSSIAVHILMWALVNLSEGFNGFLQFLQPIASALPHIGSDP